MFDNDDRKIIENLGLNCIFIDESNKWKTYKELHYFNNSLFEKNEKV